MTTVLMYINEGRTIADCPVCNGAEFVTRGEPFICSRCNPSIKGDMRVNVKGYMIAVKDPAKAIEARLQIIASGRAAEVIFPANFEAIMAVLSERSNITNMNWYPAGHPRKPAGESVQDLMLENLAHGIPAIGGK